MKKILLFTFCAFLASFSNGQNVSLDWARMAGGGSFDQLGAMAVDPSGDQYLAGIFYGTVDFDPGPGTTTLVSAGLGDLVVARYDVSGHLVWAKNMGGSSDEMGYSIALDQNQNIFVCGYMSSASADFDPSAATFTLSATNGKMFLLKLDSGGNFLWAKNFGPSNINSFGYGVISDPYGNVYMTGVFSGISDMDPGPSTFTLSGSNLYYVSKFTATGNFVWSDGFAGISVMNGKPLATDASGHVLLTGNYAGTVDFDPTASTYTVASVGFTDAFVLSLSAASGTLGWVASLGSVNGYEQGTSIAVDFGDNVYTTGIFSGTTDFDPGAGNYTVATNGNYDVYISKLTPSGGFVWAKTVGGPNADKSRSISVNAGSLNLHVTGNFLGITDFDPGIGTVNLTAVTEDIFLMKLDVNGTYVVAKSLGGPSIDDTGVSIETDAFGNIYLAGNFSGLVDFDPNAAILNINGPGTSNIFVERFVSCTAAPPNPINTTPSANFKNCSGLTTTLTALTGTYTSINWYTSSTATAAVASGSAFVTSSTLAPGTYTYYAAASGCSLSPAQIPIVFTVNVTPTISVNSGTLCSGRSFTLIPSGAATYTFEGGSAIVSPTTNSSTYSVTGTSSLGCVSSNTAVSAIALLASPNVSVTITTSVSCMGDAVILTGSGAPNYSLNNVASTSPVIVIIPTASATYTMTGYDPINGCSSGVVFTQSVNVCTGLKTFSSAPFMSVYPNPGNGIYTLELNTAANLVIINTLGEILLNENRAAGKSPVDLTNQSNGIYFIKIIRAEDQQTLKIIKH